MKKFFISMVATVLVVTAIALGLQAAQLFFGSSLSSEITKLLDKATNDTVNILCLGLDKDGTRSDVIMVVSIDSKREQINILSIPRDTRVRYPNSKYDKINHAMGYKKPEETIIGLVKQVTGMPIHYYCEIDFEGFRNVIDILGGVEFNVPMDMHYEDPTQDLYIHVNKGYQKLNGKQAEGVVRFRAGYATGDNGRIPVQQDFIHALFEQKLKPQYIIKAPTLMKEIYENVNTNFTVSDAMGYVKLLRNLSADSLGTYTLPGQSSYISGVSYYVYDEAETRQLILEKFGYPEDEAKRLEKQKAKAEGE